MNYRGLLLAVVLALLSASPAAACQGPDLKLLDWYEINLLVKPAPMPVGVQVAPGINNQYVVVSNSGAIPLYIITPSREGDPGQTLSLPDGWAITHKLERNALFTWWNGRWFSDGQTTEAMLGLDSLMISPTLVINNATGNNRPFGELPPAATARLTLLYDNGRLDVRITLAYSLNPNYDPAQYKRINEMHCMGGGIEALMFRLVLCLFVLAVAALLIWFIRSAPRPPASQ